VNDNVTEPAGVVLEVENTMVAWAPTVAVAGDGDTDTPEGKPLTDTLTGELNPLSCVMETVIDVEAPCHKPTVVGETARMKSGVAVGPTDTVSAPGSPPPQLVKQT